MIQRAALERMNRRMDLAQMDLTTRPTVKEKHCGNEAYRNGSLMDHKFMSPARFLILAV